MGQGRDPDDIPTTTAASPGPQSDQLLVAGTRVGDYVIECWLADGGFASVYSAHHVVLSRRVALKMMNRSLLVSAGLIRRFQQEADLIQRIQHPNIVELYEIGSHQGQPFLAMEFLEGRDLRKEIQARGPLTPAEAMHVMEAVGGGLAAAHDLGVIHRDLKAANVMAVPDGDWFNFKLLDFGIAKLVDRGDPQRHSELTSTGLRLGTPWTMAPEQILGLPADARTDIYALGLLLYHLLTGQHPFSVARSEVEIEELQLWARPPNVSELAPVPPTVDAVVQRALRKDRVERYPDVRAFLTDLRQAMATSGPLAVARLATVGIGLYVEVHLAAGPPDDAVFADYDAVLAMARAVCERAPLHLELDGGSAFLGVTELPVDATAALGLRDSLLERALELRQTLASRCAAHPRVTAAVQVDVASLLRGGTQARYVGGDLLSPARWIRLTGECEPVPIRVTDAVVAGLQESFRLAPLAAPASGHRLLGR
jgi:serine/threonine-protein kinase